MSQPKLTLKMIQEALKDVEFMDREFLVMEKGDGFLIQMSYMEEDVENPDSGPILQKTRKWYCSPYMTESELVETCWAMVCRSQMHIAGEHFKYKGRRVYSPHFDVDARIKLCDENSYDVREPIVEQPNGPIESTEIRYVDGVKITSLNLTPETKARLTIPELPKAWKFDPSK